MKKRNRPVELHPYDRLTPDVVAAAVESLAMTPNGYLLALNSYENRVYQVGVEDGPTVVVKFYRPDRHTDAGILDEHAFALELARDEVPVVPPMVVDGRTLFRQDGFRFAVFERHGGRWPELGTKEDRAWVGRFIGRLHMIGKRGRFLHRSTLTVDRLGADSRDFLLREGVIPDHIHAAYESVSEDVLEGCSQAFADAGDVPYIRIHGDCHPGNVLWTDAGPHFVDLDDCMQGPAIQDIWMLLSGSRREMSEQLAQILEGYAQFADFDYRELLLIEALRSLRIMHYACWLARRWDDPAFPRAFPWFSEPRFWEQHVLNLREQLAALQDEPLNV